MDAMTTRLNSKVLFGSTKQLGSTFLPRLSLCIALPPLQMHLTNKKLPGHMAATYQRFPKLSTPGGSRLQRIATVLTTIGILVNVIFHCWSKFRKAAARMARLFTFAEMEMEAATQNFNDADIQGKGGFGFVVYIQRIAMVSTVVILVGVIFHCWSKFRKAAAGAGGGQAVASMARRFTFAEMKAATDNFNASRILGKGGFGIVYEGFIDDNQTRVAIKRLKTTSKQGEHEFLMELDASELRHINLVPFIGHCDEGKELILVYEYMAGGMLANWLYRTSVSSQCLSWNKYLKICIGGARSLDYLHTGCGIIHRDVKATNILLDENHVAKISDFGLAKFYDIQDEQSHVSTKVVKGTHGYMDPNYQATGKLTRMSDTYAFGVVLLEVLCGQTVHNQQVEKIKRKLATGELMSWEEVYSMIIPRLRDEIFPESLKAFLDIVEGCLHSKPQKRPTMAQVVVKLESLLEQHKSPRSMGKSTEVYISNYAFPTDASELVASSSSSVMQTNNKAILSPRKHYILTARNLAIGCGDISECWKWISHPKSRFSEVAELLRVCRLEIQGIINTEMLYAGVNYAAYLLYSFTSDSMAYDFKYPHAETFMGLRNCNSKKLRYVRLDLENPDITKSDMPVSLMERRRRKQKERRRRPKKRDDGWMEVELGEYFVEEGESYDLELNLKGEDVTHWKTGLIIEGIEIRPKEKKEKNPVADAAKRKEEPPKPATPADDGKKEEAKYEEESSPPLSQEIILEVYMHCEDCAYKVRRCLKDFGGVEKVITDCGTGKVVVQGQKVDPVKVLERVQKETGRRQVKLISPYGNSKQHT